jgi:hypothetical protein
LTLDDSVKADREEAIDDDDDDKDKIDDDNKE